MHILCNSQDIDSLMNTQILEGLWFQIRIINNRNNILEEAIWVNLYQLICKIVN